MTSKDTEAKVIEMSELLKATGPAPLDMGAICRSHRAENLFGWKPREGDLKDEIVEVVRSEAERAGLGNGA